MQRHLTICICLSSDEAKGERSLSSLTWSAGDREVYDRGNILGSFVLSCLLLKDALQVSHVVMLESLDLCPGQGGTVLDGKASCLQWHTLGSSLTAPELTDSLLHACVLNKSGSPAPLICCCKQAKQISCAWHHWCRLGVSASCWTYVRIWQEVADLIIYYDILRVCKSWQDAGYCCQVISINDSLLCLHKLSELFLQLQVHIYCTIKSSRATRTYTILGNGCCTSLLQRTQEDAQRTDGKPHVRHSHSNNVNKPICLHMQQCATFLALIACKSQQDCDMQPCSSWHILQLCWD